LINQTEKEVIRTSPGIGPKRERKNRATKNLFYSARERGETEEQCHRCGKPGARKSSPSAGLPPQERFWKGTLTAIVDSDGLAFSEWEK